MSSLAPLNSNYRHRKGLVTDVSGPQRNACPGTLTPLSGICCCLCFSGNQGRRCGQERGCYETHKSTRCWKFSMITEEKPTNEMVRRLIPPLCQEDGGGSF